MNYGILVIVIFLAVLIVALQRFQFKTQRKRRREYYRNEYLISDAWARKRYVVLRRDKGAVCIVAK